MAALLLAAILTPATWAQTVLFWSVGDGDWSTDNTNWSTSSEGSADSVWINGNNAVFASTGGTVTVLGEFGVTVGNITFGAGGYFITGGTINFASGTTSIFDTVGFDATIGSTLTGLGGLEKVGTGTLTLTGSNDYSGGTTISGGTLFIAQPKISRAPPSLSTAAPCNSTGSAWPRSTQSPSRAAAPSMSAVKALSLSATISKAAALWPKTALAPSRCAATE